MAVTEFKVSLKVGMYTYIPNLNEDDLKNSQEMIKNNCEKENPDVPSTLFV